MRELTKSNWTKSSTRPKQHFFPSVLIKLGWYTLSLAHSRIILIWLFIHSSTPTNSDAARASSNQFRWLNKWRATACTTHFGQNLTRFEKSFCGQIRIRTQSALDGWGEKQGRDEVNQARNWNSVQWANKAVPFYIYIGCRVSLAWKTSKFEFCKWDLISLTSANNFNVISELLNNSLWGCCRFARKSLCDKARAELYKHFFCRRK